MSYIQFKNMEEISKDVNADCNRVSLSDYIDNHDKTVAYLDGHLWHILVFLYFPLIFFLIF